MMTREDMLRELELLPVWRLRSQLQVPVIASAVVQTTSVITESVSTNAVLEVDALLISTEPLQPLVADLLSLEPIEQALDKQAHTGESLLKEFTYIASEDGDWLFVLPNKELQPDEAILLRNILVAMRLKAKSVNMLAMTDVLATTLPKIIIAMGEATAQYFLESSETLASLRGKHHRLQDILMVCTYDPAHLLEISSDKSKAWDDLCLAMQALHDLKSTSLEINKS